MSVDHAPSPVLELRGVRRTYLGRGRQPDRTVAVRDVDLTVHAGEVVALVGQSGAGKSTLARLALGVEPPDHGDVRVEGVDLAQLRPRERRRQRRRSHLILQDPYQAFHPSMTVGASVAEPLAIAGVPRSKRIGPVLAALEEVALTPPRTVAGRYPHELSGGQRQRAAFARALTGSPALVVADEPVSMLDVSLQAGVLDLVRRLRSDHDVAVLFITHDLAVARVVADRIGVMYGGRLLELGPTPAVIDDPQHPYTRVLMAAAEELQVPPDALSDLPPGGHPCDLSGTCTGDCVDVEPRLLEVTPGHLVAAHRSDAS